MSWMINVYEYAEHHEAFGYSLGNTYDSYDKAVEAIFNNLDENEKVRGVTHNWNEKPPMMFDESLLSDAVYRSNLREFTIYKP